MKIRFDREIFPLLSLLLSSELLLFKGKICHSCDLSDLFSADQVIKMNSHVIFRFLLLSDHTFWMKSDFLMI